ncbi:DUF2007 domain-containing protein [Porphyromonadaceae bacterium W3.11]|nr:DUF2007 domain-containing protein [Porphyromonadaceae bacterium W3.11]
MLVEVYNSIDPNEGHLAYTLLEDRDFFVRLENEHMSQIPGMSRGLSVMVREEDYNKARAILEEAGYLPVESNTTEEMEAEMAKERKAFTKKMTFILLGLFILLALLAIASRVLVVPA